MGVSGDLYPFFDGGCIDLWCSRVGGGGICRFVGYGVANGRVHALMLLTMEKCSC